MVVFAHAFGLFWVLKTWALNKAATLAKTRAKDKQKAATSTEGRTSPSKNRRDFAATRRANGDTGPAGTDQGGRVPVESPFVAGVGLSDKDSFKSADSADDGDDIPDLSATACATLRRTLSVETETLAMEWQDMGCAYILNGKRKEVLKGIYGEARPGEMHALMGPSGAGKSTFMDCLALRKSVGELSGQLLLNGQPATKSFIRKTAYVPQDDNFVPTMTTWETLSFYANVILPQNKFNRATRKSRVTEVLAALGLGHAHKTLVGGCLPGGLMLRGLSGGERKRLAVGAGILAAPAVLFLDEPTSGLDSFAALSVMGYLQKMARATGQIVITTIHQPRSAIWQMFDSVTLLANGRLMYTGKTDSMIDWFGSQGYQYDSNLHGVPSDWALDLVAVGFSKPAKYYGHTMRTEQDLLAASGAFTNRYLANHQAAKAEAGTLDRAASIVAKPQKKTGYPTGWFKQYSSLLSREFLSVTRNPFDVAGRTLTFCWVGILEGLLFFNLPNDGNSLRTRLNTLFCILSFVILMPYISMGLYTADKKFYLADASAKLYRPSAYYLAKVTATLPFQIICALVFDWTVYGMAGLRFIPATIFKHAVLVNILYLIAVQVLHLCAMLAPNQDTAFMLSLVWTTLQMLLSNFFISFSEVYMVWLRYFRYISALYYTLEGATLLEFKDIKFSCEGGISPKDLQLIFNALPGIPPRVKTQIMLATGPRRGCIVDANAIINYYDYNRLFGMSVGILLIYWLGLHVLTFIVMRVAARKENR